MFAFDLEAIPVLFLCFFFFFNDTATTEIYTLSLHDALPISTTAYWKPPQVPSSGWRRSRSEEHTSELQSRRDLVCRLLLEKKKKTKQIHHYEKEKEKNDIKEYENNQN